MENKIHRTELSGKLYFFHRFHKLSSGKEQQFIHFTDQKGWVSEDDDDEASSGYKGYRTLDWAHQSVIQSDLVGSDVRNALWTAEHRLDAGTAFSVPLEITKTITQERMVTI